MRYPRGSYTIIGNHVLERVIRAAPAAAAVELALEARQNYRQPGLTKLQLQQMTGRGETSVRVALQRLISEGRGCQAGDRFYIARLTAQNSAGEHGPKTVKDDTPATLNKRGKLGIAATRRSSIQAILEAAWAGVGDAE